MYHRSDKFDNKVKQSHKIATKCEVLVNGVSEMTLDIIDGDVTIDDVAIRRRATVALTDPTGDLVPDDAEDLLMVAGNEYQLWRGIDYQDGTDPEYLSLGIFAISDVQIEDSGQGLHISLDGFDRSRGVAKARLPNDYKIVRGTLFTTAIQDLISYRVQDTDFDFIDTSDISTGIVIEQGSDPWEAAQNMASSIGCDLYFDVDGTCVLRQVTDDTGDVDWVYSAGDEAMLLYTARRIQDEGVYNHVIATGETTSLVVPVRGEVYDANPLSPTYWKGKFGDVPYFFTSSFFSSTEQATAAALRQLAKTVGFYERIETISIVHPAHELGDVIGVTHHESRIDSIYVIDKLTIPMVHSRGMNISTRSRRLPDDDVTSQ